MKSINQEQELDQQIAELISEAPDDGLTSNAVGMIASVLKAAASQLNHTNYYILQSEVDGWLLTTLSNRNSPEVEKNVVYVYASHTAANIERIKINDPELECQEMAIIPILFRLVVLKEVDSLIFFDHPTDTQKGTEINRAELRDLCEQQIKRLKFTHNKLNRMRTAANAQKSQGGFSPHIA